MTKESKYRFACVLLLVLTFAYTCARAHLLSMTHDEALSYIYFDYFATFKEVINYTIPTSNNHLLNSLLMKFFTQHLGNSEFVIRLPTLIGHALYLFGIYQILRLFLKGPRLLIGTALLISHPLLLDYFSCARGYGLGLGFMSLGFYFCFKEIRSSFSDSKIRNLFLAFLMLTLSALGNLAFLNVFMTVLAFFVFLQLVCIIKEKESFPVALKRLAGKILLPIFPNVITLAVIYTNPILKLQKAHEFYHGGDEGFWKDTVLGLLNATLYGKTYFHLDAIPFLWYFILTAVILAVLFLFYDFLKKKRFEPLHRYLSFITFVTLVSSLSIVLQHVIFGVVYPHDRAAIYYIPIFFILFLLIWNRVAEWSRTGIKIFILFTFYGFSGILLLHFASCANLTHFYFNQPDAHTKEMMQKIVELTKVKNLPPRSLRLGIHWWFEPAINYYIIRNNLTWIRYVDRGGPDGIFNYYYVREPDKEIITKYNLEIIKKYDLSDTYLAAQKNS